MTGTELSRTVSSARPAARVLLLTGLVIATALGGSGSVIGGSS